MNILKIFIAVILIFPEVLSTYHNLLYMHNSYTPPNQSTIEISISTYTQYRYLYNQPPSSDLVIFFSNEIAKAMNATLFASPFYDDIEKDNLLLKVKHPSVLPFARVQFINNRNSSKTLWEIYTQI